MVLSVTVYLWVCTVYDGVFVSLYCLWRCICEFVLSVTVYLWVCTVCDGVFVSLYCLWRCICEFALSMTVYLWVCTVWRCICEFVLSMTVYLWVCTACDGVFVSLYCLWRCICEFVLSMMVYLWVCTACDGVFVSLYCLWRCICEFVLSMTVYLCSRSIVGSHISRRRSSSMADVASWTPSSIVIVAVNQVNTLLTALMFVECIATNILTLRWSPACRDATMSHWRLRQQLRSLTLCTW